jgi:diacylglycerol kinase (ATP)
VSPGKNQPFLSRLGFAWNGLCYALRAERSLRFQAVAFVAVVATLAALNPEPVWWALTLLASSSVIAAEIFNTALEHLLDHVHPETHSQIRIVKDCSAAAVLLTVVGAITVGVALAVHVLRHS